MSHSKKENPKKKPYVAPKLKEFGQIRDFTQAITATMTADGGVGLSGFTMNCVSLPPFIQEHRWLLQDTKMQEQFRAAIFKKVKPGDVVLDLGTGTGLHAFFAVQAGAAKVYAVDNDPLAVKATDENRALNLIPAEKLIVDLGSIEKLQLMIPAPVDGFVCNILADVIIQLAPSMAAIVKPKGWAILSGILSSQVADVSHVLEQNGWVVGTVWNRLEWSCINLKYK